MILKINTVADICDAIVNEVYVVRTQSVVELFVAENLNLREKFII
jgi:hypothetical protein